VSACACGWGTGWIRQWYKANSQACTGTRSLLMKDEKSVLLEGRIFLAVLQERESTWVSRRGGTFFCSGMVRGRVEDKKGGLQLQQGGKG
jgi:hypothetical protein